MKRRSAACSTLPPALPRAPAIADAGTDGKNSVSCASACARKSLSPVLTEIRTAAHSLRRGVCLHWSVMGRTASCFVGDAICCGTTCASGGFGTACARNMLPGGRPQHSEPTRQRDQSIRDSVCVHVHLCHVSVWRTCRAQLLPSLTRVPADARRLALLDEIRHRRLLERLAQLLGRRLGRRAADARGLRKLHENALRWMKHSAVSGKHTASHHIP